jgi:hypothetical protein
MEKFHHKVNYLKQTLTVKQQKMLSLNSIENFLLSYDKLTNYKYQVRILLSNYFEEIEKLNYIIDKDTSTRLAFDYLTKIGSYYSLNLGFKTRISLNYVLIVGLQIDCILLLFGILKRVYYIPVATLILFCYMQYVYIFYEKKNKVYMIRY